MAGKTNELVGWCREASIIHDAREYGMRSWRRASR